LNSKQIILSYRSNCQPQTNHKQPDFWILFLILNPKYVHVFKSAILLLILNPTYESLFQVQKPKFQDIILNFFNRLSLHATKQNTTNNSSTQLKKIEKNSFYIKTILVPRAADQRAC
jgi:hypothetical protein